MSKLLVVTSNGFEEIEAVSIIDVCRRADIDVTIASINDLEVIGAHNITIKADVLLKDIDSSIYDMIVLPGGLPNAFNLANDENLKSILREFKEMDKKIGAICAAPFALHTSNVLGDKYTCYPSFEKKIKDEGYDSTSNVVSDGNIITSRGPATAMEFGLEIVKTLKGEEVYNQIASGLLFK